MWNFEEEFFGELSHTFSARLSNKYGGVSEDDNSSEYSLTQMMKMLVQQKDRNH